MIQTVAAPLYLGARTSKSLKSMNITCKAIRGFDLHAAVRIGKKDGSRLERLCRYTVRPAVAHSRLAIVPNGLKLPLKKAMEAIRLPCQR